MPLLLLLPLLLLGVLALWALLLPVALVQRYRRGRLRRRLQPLAVRINAWLLLASAPLFVAGAWIGSYWVTGAVVHALGGLGAGIALGVLGLALSRFEATPRGWYWTPPAWLVLALTVLVAARIAWGIAGAWQRWHGAVPGVGPWAQQAGVFAAGGVLLGYALAQAWGLKRRLGLPRPAS